MNKSFLSFFVANFLFQTLSFANQPANYNLQNEPGIYDKIAKLYLPTLVDKEKDEEKLKNEILGKNSIPPMSLGSVEALRAVYGIFSDPQMMVLNGDTCKKQLVDDCVFDDLGLFRRKFFNNIDFTQTPFGKAKLQSLFFKKFNNINDCENDVKLLQQKVKFLVENEELYEKINEKLIAMKGFFGELLWLWKPRDELSSAFFDQVYFSKIDISLDEFSREIDLTEFNKNKFLLASNFAYGVWGALWFVSLYYLFKMAFEREGCLEQARAGMAYNLGVINKIYGDWDKFAEYANFPGSNAKIIDAATTVLAESGINVPQDKPINPHFLSLSLFNKLKYFFFESQFYSYKYFLPLLVAVGCLGLHIYSSYKQSQSYKKVFDVIHKKMLKFAEFADYTSEFKHFLGTNDELKTMLESYSKYKKVFMSEDESVELDHLLKDFMQTDKCRKPSFFMGKGKVLAKFNDLLFFKTGLMADFILIGEIDMLMSIATLYKKYANHHRTKYCFAKFVQSDSPYLNIQDFWHPSLNPDTAEPNSIELGSSTGGHNAVVSGPNAAGKSSTIEGAEISVIMAMTMGIAPAESITLTPFTRISSHLNISYEVGKQSLFQAEMNRAYNFLDDIKKLKPGEFEFVIMDELFSSTNPEEGMSGAVGIMKNLVNYPNCTCILTTHFKKLQELEASTNGYFRNYKVFVELFENGKFKPAYKLVPGISDQSMALLLMNKRGFDKQIIKDAFDVLAEVKEDRRNIIVPEGFAY